MAVLAGNNPPRHELLKPGAADGTRATGFKRNVLIQFYAVPPILGLQRYWQSGRVIVMVTPSTACWVWGNFTTLRSVRTTQLLLQVQQAAQLPPSIRRAAWYGSPPADPAQTNFIAKNMSRKTVLVDCAGERPALDIIPLSGTSAHLPRRPPVVTDGAPSRRCRRKPFCPPAGPAYLLSQMSTGTPLMLP